MAYLPRLVSRDTASLAVADFGVDDLGDALVLKRTGTSARATREKLSVSPDSLSDLQGCSR